MQIIAVRREARQLRFYILEAKALWLYFARRAMLGAWGSDNYLQGLDNA